jgi:hypothetical protein
LLNRTLLNLRKSGELKGIRKSVMTRVKGQDEFRFASEIAIRYLERKNGWTLDQTLCDPTKAQEFDAVAERIVPGRTPFEYRWAAFGLRKRKQLKPELLSRLVRPEKISHELVVSLQIQNITRQSGLYVFFNSRNVLYVGESQNLRKRIGKHLEHSDNREFARWLWGEGIEDLRLEIQVLPEGTPSKIRKALERELIINRNPIFNISGVR